MWSVNSNWSSFSLDCGNTELGPVVGGAFTVVGGPVVFFAEFDAEAAAEGGVLLDPAVAEAGADEVGKGEEAFVEGFDGSVFLGTVVERAFIQSEFVELAGEVGIGMCRGWELVEDWDELLPVGDGVGGVDVAGGVAFVVVGGGEPAMFGLGGL